MSYDKEAQTWDKKRIRSAWNARFLCSAAALALLTLSAISYLSPSGHRVSDTPVHRRVRRQAFAKGDRLYARQGIDVNVNTGANATSGGNGSIVTLKNGTTFTYVNNFGGTWASRPGDFSARAQASSPALNETWDWNIQRTHGVNLGGWLVTEPFITPELYMSAGSSAVDEYTLSEALGDRLGPVLTNHYEVFITERDFAAIAAAGLNWIRLPVPYWAIETQDDEPYLEGVAWNYMLQAFEWARKYGLRVELDLHTVPGSQNGLNHSGRLGTVGFLNGVMGIANAQRTLNYIRILTETVSQPNYAHVMLFNIVNEAYISVIGPQALRSFYLEAYNTMRNITGIGAGKGPQMVIHDGFISLDSWNGFMTGADRLALESHYYFAFSPSAYASSIDQFITRPCNWWASNFNQSTNTFGIVIGGEWSLAVNDCGLFVTGVGSAQNFDGSAKGSTRVGSCTPYTDVSQFSDQTKQQLQQFALASMDTFQNFMFWTWKTQQNSTTGRPYNPLWCYSCGLQYGYIPKDPTQARGACDRISYQLGTPGYAARVSVTPLAASKTGNAATSSPIASAQIASYGKFPPTSLTSIDQASLLPRYTATGAEPALPTAPPTNLANVNATGTPTASNWYTPIAGCSYLDPYSGVGAKVPAAACTGGSRARK